MAPTAISITPYRSNKDLIRLRQWFYHNDDTLKKKLALEKVKVYLSRGKVPHAVNATASLVALEIMEQITESEGLQHAYCSALTRLVNGLLDPFQQASVALPLLKLAKEIGLPSSFVEIRHMATHEELPSLSHLRLVASEAKQWLYDNFWVHIVEKAAEVPERDDHFDHAIAITAIASDLKAYRRTRKLNVDAVPTLKDDEAFQAIVKRLKNGLSKSAFRQRLLQELVFNHLIYTDTRDRDVLKRMKFRTLVKIYEPLFTELGSSFQVDLLFALIQYSSDYASVKFSAQEQLQTLEWALYLISRFECQKFPIDPDFKDLASLRQSIEAQLSILPALFPLRVELEGLIQTSKVNGEAGQKRKFHMPPSLDELFGPSKRQKLSELPTPHPTTVQNKTEELPAVDLVFTQCANWKPQAFGIRKKS